MLLTGTLAGLLVTRMNSVLYVMVVPSSDVNSELSPLVKLTVMALPSAVSLGQAMRYVSIRLIELRVGGSQELVVGL